MLRFLCGYALGTVALILPIASLHSPPAAAGGDLRAVWEEYGRLEGQRGPDHYRTWLERFDRAVANDPQADPLALYFVRREQGHLCQWLKAWEDAVRHADDAARLAPSPVERFLTEYDAAFAARELLPDRAAMQSPAGERLLARYAALREQVERPDGLAARGELKKDEVVLTSYLAVLSNHALLIKERGALEQACAVYDNALRLVNDGRLPTDAGVHILNNRAALLTERGAHREALELYERSLRLLRESPPFDSMFGDRETMQATPLYGAMICAAHCKDKARSERYLLELVRSKVCARRPAVAALYVLDLARAEDPVGGAAYQARLKWWVDRVGPSHPSWARSMLFLARSLGAQEETLPEEARLLEQLLSAYANSPPPEGVEWRSIRWECWARLAELYGTPGTRLSNLPRARELARRYLEETREQCTEGVQQHRMRLALLLRELEAPAPR